tara:strand:- start:1661 stop:2158 length:498 start_codon:yes stop_codon:yes gene_type:complete
MANPMYGQNKFDDSADRSLGVVEHLKPASDGSVVSPSKTLTNADAGNVYIVDISANTAAFVLPSAKLSKGAKFTFILSIESNAEATKDLIVASGSASEYLMGVGIDAGVVHDQQSDDDQIMIDTSAGAAGAGDRISVICDGSHWYVLDASALSAGAFVSGTATRS